MPNENIIVRNLSGPKWRRNGHGPAESIWPMQSFGGHGFKDMVYTEFNVKIFRSNELWIQIILLMNATEIQKVATNGINEIPVCGLNWN